MVRDKQATKPDSGPLDGSYPGPFDRRLLTPRWWPSWLGLALFRGFSRLPRRWRYAMARRLGDIIYARHEKRRRFVQLNLSWCFPELSGAQRERLARDYFRCMVQSLFDYGVLWWGSERRLNRILELRGAEHLEDAQRSGKGVILLTTHNLGLDFGAAALTRHFPSVGLIKEARNPVLDWLMARGRTRFRGILFRREQGLRPVLRAVRHGHAFYYLPDEDLGPQGSVFVPFFGVPTATITALPRLTRMGDALVLPFTTVFDPGTGRYIAHIFPPLEDYPGGDDGDDAARMNRELERLIRMAPEQYMWSLRLFQTRPNGEPNPYG